MADHAETGFQQLILRARRGDDEALGQLLDGHRPYLRLLARRFLDGPLAQRLDASDVIQQTLLSAFRNFEKFDGEATAEFVAWLTRIHERNLHDVVRRHRLSRKRSVEHEERVESDMPFVDPRASSPSRRLLRGEQAVRLAAALEELTNDQREAIRLRHLEGLSLADIAMRLGRSESAVAGLIHRGLASLRRLLEAQRRNQM